MGAEEFSGFRFDCCDTNGTPVTFFLVRLPLAGYHLFRSDRPDAVMKGTAPLLFLLRLIEGACAGSPFVSKKYWAGHSDDTRNQWMSAIRRKVGSVIRYYRDPETDTFGYAFQLNVEPLSKADFDLLALTAPFADIVRAASNDKPVATSPKKVEGKGVITSRAEALQKYLSNVIEEHGVRALPAYFPDHLRDDGGFADIHQPVRVVKLGKQRDGFTTAQAKPHSPESPRGELNWEDTNAEQPREGFLHTVVLGEPGYGKTWLLRYEAIRLAREALLRVANGEDVRAIEEIPVLLRLPDLDFYISEESPDLIAAILQCIPEDFREMARELLANSRVVLLLDGWDEINNGYPFEKSGKDARRPLEQALKNFAGNRSCRIVLTSRRSGFVWPPFSNAAELEMSPFGVDEVAAFTQRWFRDAPEKLARLNAPGYRSPSA